MVDPNRTGDVLELCTLSQRSSRHAFRRAGQLVAERRLANIVVRRLAAFLTRFVLVTSAGIPSNSDPVMLRTKTDPVGEY